MLTQYEYEVNGHKYQILLPPVASFAAACELMREQTIPQPKLFGFPVVIDESLKDTRIHWYLRADDKPPIVCGDFE